MTLRGAIVVIAGAIVALSAFLVPIGDTYTMQAKVNSLPRFCDVVDDGIIIVDGYGVLLNVHVECTFPLRPEST